MHPSPTVLTEPIPAPETAEDAVMSLMLAVGRRMRQRQPGDEIDYSSFPILKLLTHQGPMRLSALASVLGLDASTVSRHARQLEDRGLLERTGDPDDGRASRVTVSEQGNACLAHAFATRREVLSHALDGWTDEERETLRLMLHRLHLTLMTHADQQDSQVTQTTTTGQEATA
jgi:DNA-binding MarR family transcriptional regulator